MLSPTERNRLINREGIRSQERASNYARVRKKLAMWLNEDLADVFLCIKFLPEDQLKRVFEDPHIFRLFALVERMMEIKDFRAVYGKADDPEEWKVTKPGEMEPDRLAEDQDVRRAWKLMNHLDNLYIVYGHENLLKHLATLLRMDEDEKIHDRVTEGERKGLERIKRVLPRRVGRTLSIMYGQDGPK